MEQAVLPVDRRTIEERANDLYEKGLNVAHKAFFTSEFQEEIWRDNYQFENETIRGTMNRLVAAIYPEESLELQNAFFYALINKRISFGGRVVANMGTGIDGVMPFNCYAMQRSVKPVDSIKNIYTDLHNAAEILKTEGGCGYDFSHLRPRGTFIKGIRSATPGVVKFMELWDKTSEIITQSNPGEHMQMGDMFAKKKIRKGAQIAILSIYHPDIIEYIESKSKPDYFTKFNISVGICDAFMNALIKDNKWEFWFPDIHHENYDDEWDGDFEKWAEKYPKAKVVYDTIPAKDLWDLIIWNTWKRNDPGLFFIDNANKYNNLAYTGRITGTNPCIYRKERINTSSGLVKLESLLGQGNNIVLTDDKISCLRITKVNESKSYEHISIYPEYSSVSSRMASPVQLTQKNAKIYKLTTEHGYEIKVTANHEFPTSNGVKRLDELIVGDKLFIQSKEGLFGNFGTYEQGLILGLITGDGTISRNNNRNTAFIDIWGEDINEDDLSYIKNIITNEVSKLDNLGFNKNRKYKDYNWFNQISNQKKKRIGGIKLYRWLDEILDAKNTKKEVPECVFTGTQEFVKGYIQGMWFSDGTVGLSGKTTAKTLDLRLNQSNEKLLKDIQILLGNFGIVSRIYSRRKAQYRTLSDGKDGKKEYWCKENFDLIINRPNSIIFEEKINIFGRKKHILKERLDKRGRFCKKPERFITKIKSIEYFCQDDVFCLNQPDTHSIFVNNISTLQCGEITMIADPQTFQIGGQTIDVLGDICNLGHLNLVSYYKPGEEDDFDWQTFVNDIALLIRALDNIIDLSSYPLPGLENAAKLRRKLGAGMLGYGSLLMMKKMRYGSKKANKFTEKLESIKANHSYQASAKLASEKGPMPLYDKEQIFDNGFIKNSGVLWDSTIKMIKENGLRNMALNTNAPTGNTGIYMGFVSGGIEPVFDLEYYRWAIVSHNHDTELAGMEYPEFWKGEWNETKDFKFVDVAGEEVLESLLGEFRIDKNRGLIKKILCIDYGWKWIKENCTQKEIDKLTEEGVFATAMKLNVKEHLTPFKIFSKYTDNSVSKTLNVAEDYPIEEFSSMFIDLWKSGARGCTTYRMGSATQVLESANKSEVVESQEEFYDAWKEHGNGDITIEQVSLPLEYPMKGYKIRSEGKKWYFHVAFKDEGLSKPFAIFVQTNHRENDVNAHGTINNLMKLARTLKIPKKYRDETESKSSGQNNVAKITRNIGMLLRHNVPIKKIVETLDKMEVPVATFVFTMKKFLCKFVAEGTQAEIACESCESVLVYEQGCIICKNCGWSRC